MKNKNVYIGVSVVLLAIVVFVAVYFVIKNQKTQNGVKNVGVAQKVELQKEKIKNQESQKQIESKNKESNKKVYMKESDELDENEKVISEYYKFIENKKFNKAYEMKSNPSMSLDEFKKIYGDVKGIRLQFIPHQNSKKLYRVYVYYKGSDTKQPLEHKVKMKVNDNKIQTVSSVANKVEQGNNMAYVARIGDKLEVILVKKDNEYVIDKIEIDKEYYSNRFDNIAFSKDGTKLFYTIIGWEYVGNVIYDIVNEKKLTTFDWATMFMTPLQDFVYTCTGAGLGTGPGGVIYDIRDGKFEQVYELSRDFPQAQEFAKIQNEEISYDGKKYIMDVECKYIDDENAILFNVNGVNGDDYNAKFGSIKYFLDSNKVKIEKKL